MKKLFFVFATVMFLATSFAVADSAPALNGSTATIGYIRIKNESTYYPFPAEPGKYIDVWLSIRNFGRQTLNAECRIAPKFPFSMEPGEEAYRTFEKLAPDREILLKYKVKINENAVEGNNDLTFECRERENGESWAGKALKIYVQPQDAVISVESVESEPLQIEPGKTAKVKVTLKNAAQVTLKDISIILDLSSKSIPISPIGGISEKAIALLEAGEETSAYFDVVTSFDAEAGVYKIPLNLTYYDKLGKSYVLNQTTSLSIHSNPKLQVIAESSDIYKQGVRGSIVFKIVNLGLTDVKLLAIQALESSDYTLLSPSNEYVGTISSDNYETIEYNVFIEPNAQLPLELPVKLYYRDASNNQYEEIYTPKLKVFSVEEAQRVKLEAP
ncbi:MAG: COG1361 S-layer family protein, partial [Candidatus Micrarchaeia archaeon]